MQDWFPVRRQIFIIFLIKVEKFNPSKLKDNSRHMYLSYDCMKIQLDKSLRVLAKLTKQGHDKKLQPQPPHTRKKKSHIYLYVFLLISLKLQRQIEIFVPWFFYPNRFNCLFKKSTMNFTVVFEMLWFLYHSLNQDEHF